MYQGQNPFYSTGNNMNNNVNYRSNERVHSGIYLRDLLQEVCFDPVPVNQQYNNNNNNNNNNFNDKFYYQNEDFKPGKLNTFILFCIIISMQGRVV